MVAFSIASLMHEPPEIVDRFVDYYRRAGAQEILIYVDGPAPPEPPKPPAVVVACDAGFWQGRGGRPEGLENRQMAVFGAAAERCRTPWLLIVDSDEFVFGNRAIPDFLDRIPDAVDSVRVPPAEAVWGPGDPLGEPFAATHFRTTWPTSAVSRALRRLIFGRVSAQMRQGMTGHTRGKAFLRTGRGIDTIQNHGARRGGQRVTVDLARVDPHLRGMYVGHFDATGLEHWQRKWRMRIEGATLATAMSRARKAQMQRIERSIREGGDAPRALFARFHGVTRMQYLALATLGHGFRREIFAPGSSPMPEVTPPTPEGRLYTPGLS